MWISFFSWIGSMAIFIAVVFFRSGSNSGSSNIETILLILDILIGIISWFIFVSKLDKKIHIKYKDPKASLISIFSLLFSLIGGIALVILTIVYTSTVNNQAKPEAITASYKLISPGLKIGTTGEEVRILQSVLANDNSLYPSGLVSGYYGNLTQEAVKKFQNKYGINQTGEVDEQTANKFNEVYGSKSGDYYLSMLSNPTTSATTSTKTNNINVNTTTDSDPIINCTFTHLGIRKLKKSECNITFECQIGGIWYFYTDKNKCKQDQEAYWEAYWKVYYSNQNGNTNTTNNNTSTNTNSTYTLPTYMPPTSTPQNNDANPVSTAIIVQDNSQNINQQEADRISAISRCQGDVRRALYSSINNLRIQLRAKGSLGSSYFDTEKARLESEALRLMEACKNI